MRDFLGDLFFGGACYLCRGQARGIVCGECRAELPRLGGELCPRCALPSPCAAVCGRCLAEPPDYDATVAPLAYDFPADALVHALKFRGELSLAPLLAGILGERLSSREDIDVLIPVPLSAARLRSRGYNQALEI
ncbi:MAG TPA: double zinc ribbon domain-containing protein, partial [Burkholderiales bacterium]